MNIPQFSDLDLFKMFTLDMSQSSMCDMPRSIRRKDASRCREINGPFTMNDTKVPLWTIRKRSKLTRGEKHALQSTDKIRQGITTNEPGTKGRIEDLAKYYAAQVGGEEVSAFNEEN
jgi:hypothetical protein